MENDSNAVIYLLRYIFIYFLVCASLFHPLPSHTPSKTLEVWKYLEGNQAVKREIFFFFFFELFLAAGKYLLSLIWRYCWRGEHGKLSDWARCWGR